MRLFACLVILTACTHASPGPHSPAAAWNPDEYHAAIEAGLDAYLAASPELATLLGDHRFDNTYGDITKDGEAHARAALHEQAERVRVLAAHVPERATGTDQTRAGTDRPALDARILADYLDGQRAYAIAVEPTVKDPSAVLFKISTGIDRILAHPYAPLPTRIASVASRLEEIPALLKTASERLDGPRRAGLEMVPPVAMGLVALLHTSAVRPDAATLGGDAVLAARVTAAADAASTAIQAYMADVTKRFPADQAAEQPIGLAAWSEIVRLREGVTTDPHVLQKQAEDELARLQKELDALVQKFGKPGETRETFLARMASEPLADDKVLDEYRASIVRVENWLHATPFITVPWDQMHLEVTLPPPHNRAFSLASLNQSGVLDANADARFEVNAPTPDLPEPMQKALRAFHARGALDLVTVHEGIPGHYLQLFSIRSQPSKVRKMLVTFHFAEGWAHYCEQAVLDAGFDADPVPGRARAYMLRLAMQRAVRMIVDIGANEGTLTLDAAAKRLETDGMLAPAAARMEARRAEFWPGNMFAYTYGKLAIQHLRDTVKQREGAKFSLQSFHDRLLSLGTLPVATVGEVVFGVPAH